MYYKFITNFKIVLLYDNYINKRKNNSNMSTKY